MSSVGVKEESAATMKVHQGAHSEDPRGSKASTWPGHEEKWGVGEGKGGRSPARLPPKRGQVLPNCLCKIGRALVHGDCCKREGSCKVDPLMKGE